MSGSRGSQRAEFVLFGLSVTAVQGTRFAYALIAAWVLAPEDFATWALMLAALTYLPVLLLGVVNGLGRELPYLVGSGDHGRADRAERAAWLSTLVASAATLACAGLLDLIARAGGYLAMFGVAGAATLIFQMQQFAARSRLDFRRASVQQLVYGAALSVAAVVLIVARELPLATVTSLYAAALVVALTAGPFRAPARPDSAVLDDVKRLMQVGFPIMAAGVVFSFFISSDRWIAAAVLGGPQSAPYQLASLIASGLMVVPSVVSLQVYPRMAMAHGSGISESELVRMATRHGTLAASIVAPLALATGVASVVLVPLLLPSYSDGVPAVLVLCAGLVVLSVVVGLGNYLNVVGRQWDYLRVQIASIVVAVTLMVLGGRVLGVTGIAAGISVGFVLFGVLLRASVRSPYRP